MFRCCVLRKRSIFSHWRSVSSHMLHSKLYPEFTRSSFVRLFYSSQTLPGGGGVFFFFSPHLSFLFYFSGWAVQTLWDFEIRHVNPLQMFLQRNNSCAGWCGCVFPLIITVSLHTNLCFICGLCNFLKKQTTKHMYSSRQLLQEDEANVFLPSSLSTWQGRVLLLALNQACGIW